MFRAVSVNSLIIMSELIISLKRTLIYSRLTSKDGKILSLLVSVRDSLSKFNASEFLLKVVEALVTNGLVCSPSEKL